MMKCKEQPTPGGSCTSEAPASFSFHMLPYVIEKVFPEQSDVVDVLDRDFRVVWVSSARAALFQKSIGEIIGQHCYEVYRGLSQVCEQCPITETFGTGRPCSEELFLDGATGRPVWIKCHTWPVLNENGEITHVIDYARDITEYKEKQVVLSREAEINAAIAELLETLLSTPQDIPSLVLEYAKRLTNSSLGYVGYIDLDTGYLVCPTLTRDVWDACRITNKTTVFKKFNGLGGWVLNNRQSLMSNSPSSDPRFSGVPQGHVPIRSFISAPALADGKLVGQIFLANGQRDYTQRDRLVLERLAGIYALSIRRKQVETSLEMSQERYRNLVETVTDLVWEVDANGVYTYVSPTVGDILGFEPDELLGKTPFDLMSPLEAERVAAMFADLLAARRPIIALENTCIHKDGHPVVLETNGLPFFNEAGDLMGYRGVDRDITERKRVEETSRQSEEQYRVLFNSSNDAIFLAAVGPDGMPGKFIEVNDMACKRLKYPREELLHLSPANIDDALEAKNISHIMRRMMAERQVLFETVHVAKDGEKCPVEINARLFEFHGAVTILAVARDTSERKILESQLMQSQKLESIGQLAAGVAHEINNPVGFINSNLATLDEYRQDLSHLIDSYLSLERLAANAPGLSENSEITELLTQIRAIKDTMDLTFILEDFDKVISESREGTERVKKIVQDLKDFSHVDQAELRWADINKGFESTLNIVWNEIKYKAKVTKYYGDIPKVYCYPQQINQVFMNILVNAAQAMEDKGEIRIGTACLQAENPRVEVTISDTGAGISPENLGKIFDPFFTTKPIGKGTGLGLSMAYNIIKQHDGKIRVESEIGRGTTFIIELPVNGPKEPENSQTHS